MNRRNFLKGAGAVTVIVAGGVIYRSYDQGLFSVGKGAAYEAWGTWNADSKTGPLSIVRAGILAASPHNSQPWLFKVTDKRIELYADTQRNLGTFDPYLREMHLGLGCALENMVVTASASAYAPKVTLGTGSLLVIEANQKPHLVASIDLSTGDIESLELHQAIPQRHTNRGPYDLNRPLSESDKELLGSQDRDEANVKTFLFTSDVDRKNFGDAVVNATDAIIKDKIMQHDSEKWMRHSWDDIQKYRDGITIDAAGMSPLMTSIGKILPPMSEDTNGQYWLQGTRDVHVATAPVFGLIAVKDLFDVSQTLEAGRIWQRMHLLATIKDIAMHPINQPVEMVDRERVLKQEPKAAQVLANLTGDASWKPTFTFRAGYALSEAKKSPRRKFEDVIV